MGTFTTVVAVLGVVGTLVGIINTIYSARRHDAEKRKFDEEAEKARAEHEAIEFDLGQKLRSERERRQAATERFEALRQRALADPSTRDAYIWEYAERNDDDRKQIEDSRREEFVLGEELLGEIQDPEETAMLELVIRAVQADPDLTVNDICGGSFRRSSGRLRSEEHELLRRLRERRLIRPREAESKMGEG